MANPYIRIARLKDANSFMEYTQEERSPDWQSLLHFTDGGLGWNR